MRIHTQYTTCVCERFWWFGRRRHRHRHEKCCNWQNFNLCVHYYYDGWCVLSPIVPILRHLSSESYCYSRHRLSNSSWISYTLHTDRCCSSVNGAILKEREQLKYLVNISFNLQQKTIMLNHTTCPESISFFIASHRTVLSQDGYIGLKLLSSEVTSQQYNDDNLSHESSKSQV